MVNQKPALRKPKFVKVCDLEPEKRGVNLYLKVVNVSVVLEKKRDDGVKIEIAEAKVGDSTGSITFTARNEQIGVLKVGETIIVRNAKIEMYQDLYMRISVDKWGVVEANKDESKDIDKVAAEPDLSATEYELVEVA